MAEVSAGNRMMRDQVLALLLSGQKSTRSTRTSTTPAPTPAPAGSPPLSGPAFDAWTPGSRLGVGTSGSALQLSPVTPESSSRLPTDTDVRLAEITAGLVAASDKERRQTDTIRKLALQLERSEVHIRQLGIAQPPAVDHTTDSVSTRTERSVQQQEADVRQESRRRDEGRCREPRRDGSRRERTARRTRMRTSSHEEYLLEELEKLRSEKRDWARREKASRKEARDMMALLADIRSNAQRVLSEREGHLRVIARLHHQLYDVPSPHTPVAPVPPGRVDTAEHAQGTAIPPQNINPFAGQATPRSLGLTPLPRSPVVGALHTTLTARAQHELPVSPTAHGQRTLTDLRPPPSPLSPGTPQRRPLNHPRGDNVEQVSRTESLPDFAERPARAERSNSVAGDVTIPFQQLDTEEVLDNTSKEGPGAYSDSGHGSHGSHDEGADVENLRAELLKLFMENRMLSEKVSGLQQSVRVYEQRASQSPASTELHEKTPTADNAAEARCDGYDGNSARLAPGETVQKIFALDDELGVLESVVECMEFSIDTEEAERLQHTLSTMGYDGSTPAFGENRDGSQGQGVQDVASKLQSLAERVAGIRSNIALKYGKWLSDFRHNDESDESVTLPLGARMSAMPADDTVTLSVEGTDRNVDHGDTTTLPISAMVPELNDDETVSLPPGFTLEPHVAFDDATLTEQ